MTDRFLTHHLSCHILVKLFANSRDLAAFKLQKQTVFDLQLSNYSEDTENCGEYHQKSIRAVANMFLNRCSNIQPSEIYSNASQLLRIMREEHIAMNMRIELVEKVVREIMLDKDKPVEIDEQKVIALTKPSMDSIAVSMQEAIKRTHNFYMDHSSELYEKFKQYSE